MIYKMFLRNSLDTIFYDSEISDDNLKYVKMLGNEAFSFQVALGAFESEIDDGDLSWLYLEVKSDISDAVSVYSIENVPAIRVGNKYGDEWFLRKTPGMYPDCMQKCCDGRINAPTNIWKSMWININEDLKDMKSGEHTIEIKLYRIANNHKPNEKEKVAQKSFVIEILQTKLEKQKIFTTNWIHYDCIAHFSGTEMFSDKFFDVAKKYITLAAKNGQNMVLLPAFTPPLDTGIEEERATAQLVYVRVNNGEYEFDFSLMEKFINICMECGIEYFEHNHMYTQWGAEHAPKIIAEENGSIKRIFGWETDATSEEYKKFIHMYLTALKTFMSEHGYENQFFFHVSDEPSDEMEKSYTAASEYFRSELGDFPVGDALWDYKYYQNGAVQTPIVSTDHAESFLNRTESLWLYYTGGQIHNGLSNRVIGVPYERNRILGVQLYYYNICGFLHWGFNAHHNCLARKMVNPRFSSDMDGDFISGSSYLVYPDGNDVDASVRLMVCRDSMQDIRAFEKLESIIGREAVRALIRKHIPTISIRCRVTAEQLFALRNEVNEKLCN